MQLLDIHSHILPEVDDGSKSVEESIALLKLMKNQGITDVIATPHFDASFQNLDDFFSIVNHAHRALLDATQGLDLPKVYLGSEVYYFSGIGKSSGIKALTLCNSNYILLELPNRRIDDRIITDIMNLSDNLGITPILAHVERYYSEHGFKNILKLINDGYAYAQVNALSVFQPPYKHIVQRLIKKGYISFIATDTHSLRTRPPFMDKALFAVEDKFTRKYRNMFISNSNNLYEEIICDQQSADIGAIK